MDDYKYSEVYHKAIAEVEREVNALLFSKEPVDYKLHIEAEGLVIDLDERPANDEVLTCRFAAFGEHADHWEGIEVMAIDIVEGYFSETTNDDACDTTIRVRKGPHMADDDDIPDFILTSIRLEEWPMVVDVTIHDFMS